MIGDDRAYSIPPSAAFVGSRRAVVIHRSNKVRAAIVAALRSDEMNISEYGFITDALDAMHDFSGYVVLVRARDITSDPAALRTLRERGSLVVVAIAEPREEEFGLSALEAGVDEFVAIASGPRELVGRVRAAMRRARHDVRRRLTFGRLVIDLGNRTVTLDGGALDLTNLEFDLLACLALSPRVVYSREELLIRAWGERAGFQSAATVTEHVHRLRHKLGEDRAHPKWVRTVHGRGYTFDPTE